MGRRKEWAKRKRNPKYISYIYHLLHVVATNLKLKIITSFKRPSNQIKKLSIRRFVVKLLKEVVEKSEPLLTEFQTKLKTVVGNATKKMKSWTTTTSGKVSRGDKSWEEHIKDAMRNANVDFDPYDYIARLP